MRPPIAALAACLTLALASPGPGPAAEADSLEPFCVTSRTLVIRGDEAPFDATKGIYRVRGNARAVRGSLVLTAREIEQFERENRFVASHNVHLSDPTFVLSCGRLVYELARDRGHATEAPLVTRTTVSKDGDAAMLITELTARRIDFTESRRFLKPDEGDMEATGDVVLVRYKVGAIGREEEFRVTCDTMQNFQLRQRTVFAGRFKLRSPKVGVNGESATYYEDTDKFYVHVAQAWQVGPKGEAKNRIQGKLIVYDATTDTAKIVGGITGSFDDTR